MGEVINISTKQQEVAPSLSLELRLEARKRDGYGDLGPADLVAKTEHYLELEQREDLTEPQRNDVQSILNYLLGEMELRSAEGVQL
jgi:hypothetical protein